MKDRPSQFLKAISTCSLLLFTLSIVSGCQFWVSEQPATSEESDRTVLENPFTVQGQEIRHPNLYSLQLFRSGSEQSPPIIRLDSDQELLLRFDMIESETRQFRVRITHHNPDWTRSTIPPEFYMERFPEAFFGGGRPANTQRPAYRQYEYRFPNQQLQFAKSGNYMIRIEDYESRETMFALPFFITEDEGSFRSEVETVTTPRRDLRIRHIPKSRYIYPDFVEIPQFDLTLFFTQNQFWGRTMEADVWDVATPGEIHAEISRDKAFTGDYEALSLNMSDLSRLGRQIREFRPDEVPPKLLLNVDIQGLTNPRRSITGNRFGRPNPDRNALYGNLQFSLQLQKTIGESQQIYLVGDFNNWQIRENEQMRLDETSGLWTTSRFVKEGSYLYKYVIVEDGIVHDLALDDRFSSVRQEYTTFVYFRDPEQHYYRLLQTDTFSSN